MKSRYKNTNLLVTPIEKEILDFCNKKLPTDVSKEYFGLASTEEITEKLRELADNGKPPHWVSKKLMGKYQWPKSHRWPGSREAKELGSLLLKLDEEQENIKSARKNIDKAKGTLKTLIKNYEKDRIKIEEKINPLTTFFSKYKMADKLAAVTYLSVCLEESVVKSLNDKKITQGASKHIGALTDGKLGELIEAWVNTYPEEAKFILPKRLYGAVNEKIKEHEDNLEAKPYLSKAKIKHGSP